MNHDIWFVFLIYIIGIAHGAILTLLIQTYLIKREIKKRAYANSDNLARLLAQSVNNDNNDFPYVDEKMWPEA